MPTSPSRTVFAALAHIGRFACVVCLGCVQDPPLVTSEAGTPPVQVRPHDGSVSDGSSDAFVPDSSTDAQTTNEETFIPGTTVHMDGVMDAAEWEGAVRSTSAVPAMPPLPNTQLIALAARRDENYLYIAIAAGLDTQAAAVVYVDTGASGVTLAGGTLGDRSGQTDAVASNALVAVEPFSPSHVFGTASMVEPASPTTERLGWSALSQVNPFVPVGAGVYSACGGDLCETAIAWSALGVAPTARVALIARAGDATQFAQQSLPTVDAPNPGLITTVVVVP